jgi:hypothetical protein
LRAVITLPFSGRVVDLWSNKERVYKRVMIRTYGHLENMIPNTQKQHENIHPK